MSERRFRIRTFSSLIVTWTWLLLAVSGGVLYIAPRCWFADRTGWQLLGLSKDAWTALHVVAALAFVIAAAFHLYFNWRVFLGYLRGRVAGLGLEFVVSGVLVVLACVGAASLVPPFDTVVELSDRARDAWEEGVERGGRGQGRRTQQEAPAEETTPVDESTETPEASEGMRRGQGRGQGRGLGQGRRTGPRDGRGRGRRR